MCAEVGFRVANRSSVFNFEVAVMLRPKSTISAVTSKIIVVLAFLFLMITAVFGLFNSYRVDVLRADVAKANAARDAAEHRRVTQETDLKTRETAVAGGEAKIAEAENRTAKAGAELAQSQKEKTELQTQLEAKQNEIASLQKRIEEAGSAVNPSQRLAAASTAEQQPTPTRPSLEIKPEQVEETTHPPRRPKRQKTPPIKPPHAAGSPVAMSISSAKALATFAPLPEYPYEGRSQGVTRRGVCVVSVDPGSGRVTEASMTQSTGGPRLDNATVSAFRQWRFKPGTVSTVRIPIEFKP
jgi:TonB family protein